MDPVSQGVLGALVGASAARRETLRAACVAGWVGGMLTDADVLIRSAEDPLLNIEYHRHFSHALVFIPVGGLVAAGLLYFFLRRFLGWKELWLYSTLGYATAGLLDACTSYGTQLLWPFSDERIAWSVISIVDPVFTVSALVLLGLAWWKMRKGWIFAGCVFVACYLAFGTWQHSKAMDAVRLAATERGVTNPEKVAAKPSIGNLLLWRGLYVVEGRLHILAVRTGYFGGDVQLFETRVVDLVDVERLLDQVPSDSALAEDLRRFEHFSDGYVIWHPSEKNVLGDGRYAMSPDMVEPLWGIKVDFQAPEQHAPFLNFRTLGEADRERFKSMLFGQSAGALAEDR